MGRRKRMTGMLSYVGQGLFCAGLLLAWVFSDFFPNDSVVYICIGAVVLGALIAIYADFNIDMKRYSEELADGRVPALLPPGVLLSLAANALALGLLGLVMIGIENAWDNALWLAFEIGSLAIGAAFLAIGLAVNKKRTALMNASKPETTASEENSNSDLN
jgi:hypothetical protein